MATHGDVLCCEESVGQGVACGPDADPHAENVREFVQAGCDEVEAQQTGSGRQDFLRFRCEQVLPTLS